MRRALVSFLIAVAMALALLGVVAAAPGSSAAAEPGPSVTGVKQVLSGTYPWGIALGVDRGGKRHVVASRQNGELWYATDRSGSWTRKRILSGPRVPGSWVWALPSIAIDGNSRVHIAVVKAYPYDTPGGTGGIWYLTDKGRKRGSFGSKVRIGGNNTTEPSLRVVGRVRYLVFATISYPGQETWPLYFKTDRSGSWKRERIAFRGFGPSLRVDNSGRAHVAFGTPSAVRYARARTKTGDFSKPKVISAGRAKWTSGASLVLDPAGRPHVAWPALTGGERIWYTTRTSSGWKAPRAMGNGTRTDISMDARSRPHVVLGSSLVVHKWRTASGWRRSVVATDLTGGDLPPGGYYSGDVRIRAYGKRASIAWAPDSVGGGVWVARD